MLLTDQNMTKLFGSNSLTNQVKLIKLLKIFRILRISKLFKVAKQGIIQNMFDALNLSLGTTRMLKVIALQFFLVHLVACFWYLAAQFEDNLFGTWVGARGIVDSQREYKYFNAFY